jgi:hypothetical protein
MTDIHMPSSVTIEERPARAVQMNAYAAIYLVLALLWLFFFYTEITGLFRTEPEKIVEAQRVPVEQPEEVPSHGRIDES